MAIDDKKEQLSSSRVPEAPKEKAPAPRIEPQDTSLWGEKQYLRGEILRSWAKNKAYSEINLSGEEALKRSQSLFGKEGDWLQEKDIKKKIAELKKKEAYAKTRSEITEIRKDIKVAEGIQKAKKF